MEIFTIVKFILSLTIVLGLAEISKRVSPQIAGIISGLPLGTGLSIYFITYEQGIDFILNGIPWGIASLAASLILCLVYLISSKLKVKEKRMIIIIYSSILSIVSYLIVGLFIYLLELSTIEASLIFASIFVINLLLIKKWMVHEEKPEKSKSTFLLIFIRGIIVGLILLFITGLASLVGSKWANILSSFPSTLFPLILILHYEDGRRLFPYVIFGFSYSISALLVFYHCFSYFVPLFGLNYGYLIIYAICAVYLYFLEAVRRNAGRRRSKF